MTRAHLTPLVFGLLAVGALNPLQAQVTEAGTDPTPVLRNFYTKLSDTLLGGQQDKNLILIMANPGLALPETLDPNNDNDAQFLDQLVDDIPLPGPIFLSNGYKYSSLFERILTTKQLLPSPPLPLTAEETARENAALAILDPAGPQMTAYFAAMGQVETAQAAVDEAVMNGKTSSTSLNMLKSKVTLYTGLMNTSGHGNDIKSAMDTVQQISSKDGGALWQMIADRFHNYMASDGIYKTYFFPPASTWQSATSNDWTQFTFASGSTYKSSNSTTASLTASVGFTSLLGQGKEGSGSLDRVNATDAMNSKAFTLTFEAKRVNILRPWLTMELTRNNAWYLPPASDIGTLSYGTLADNAAHNAPFGVLVTSFFLVRNVNIGWSMTASEASSLSTKVSGAASANIGFINLKVGGSYGTSSSHEATSFTTNGVKVPGVQIIGWLATVPGKFPNPDYVKYPNSNK